MILAIRQMRGIDIKKIFKVSQKYQSIFTRPELSDQVEAKKPAGAWIYTAKKKIAKPMVTPENNSPSGKRDRGMGPKV